MIETLVEDGYKAFIAIYDVEGLDIPEENIEVKYYTVIAGSFKESSNAKDRVKELKDKGIDCYISTSDINGEIFNRVIVGCFRNKDNAENMLDSLKVDGYEAFIDVYIQ